MPWLKLLHICAVIVWSGALLYLPSMIAAASRGASPSPAWPRRVFIGLATPAALVAIGSGTLVFLLHGPVTVWLMAKLGTVGLLVLGHGACGLLLLRLERRQRDGTVTSMRVSSALVTAWVSACLLAVAWLVLGKPAW